MRRFTVPNLFVQLGLAADVEFVPAFNLARLLLAHSVSKVKQLSAAHRRD